MTLIYFLECTSSGCYKIALIEKFVTFMNKLLSSVPLTRGKLESSFFDKGYWKYFTTLLCI